MKKIKLEKLERQPERWTTHDYGCPSGRWKLADDEVLAEYWPLPGVARNRGVWRRDKLGRWESGVVPFKIEAHPVAVWQFGTDIGSGLVLDAKGVTYASGATFWRDANGRNMLVWRNGYGDCLVRVKVYLADGGDKMQSLLSFGHKSYGNFTVAPEGAAALAGETFEANEPVYSAAGFVFQAGQYEVMGCGNGIVRVCRVSNAKSEGVTP